VVGAAVLMLLNYHYIILFCFRSWLDLRFRLELEAFRLELPLWVEFVGFSVGTENPEAPNSLLGGFGA
jgi:hypothetical protein